MLAERDDATARAESLDVATQALEQRVAEQERAHDDAATAAAALSALAEGLAGPGELAEHDVALDRLRAELADRTRELTTTAEEHATLLVEHDDLLSSADTTSAALALASDAQARAERERDAVRDRADELATAATALEERIAEQQAIHDATAARHATSKNDWRSRRTPLRVPPTPSTHWPREPRAWPRARIWNTTAHALTTPSGWPMSTWLRSTACVGSLPSARES